MTRISIVAGAAIAFLSGGILLPGLNSFANDQIAAKHVAVPECAETFTQLKDFEWITAYTGAFSPTTGERLKETSRYVSAYVEGVDGKGHAAFGDNPQHMYIFTTASGRNVVRFLDWVGPY